MQESSSIHVRCPGCSETTLILHHGPADVRCAACGFDYAAMSRDVPRFEAFLVETMRAGVAGQLAAIALHQWTSRLGAAESAARFRDLAERHGVELPPPLDPGVFVRRVLIGVGALVAVLVAFLVYVVSSP